MLNLIDFKTCAVISILPLALYSCADDPGYCDAEALQAALDDARAGDVVRVGNCRVTGTFAVPSGVRVAGHGPEYSVIRVPPGENAVGLKLLEGAGITAVDGLAFESDGEGAIVSYGAAEVHIEQVDVVASLGIGIGLQDADTVIVTDVTITGPIDESNAGTVAPNPDDVCIEDTATHGLVLFRVADATVNNTTVAGFALFGGLLVDSTTNWVGGELTGNLGTGMMVQGGTADLNGLQVINTLQGARLIPAYGVVINEVDSAQSTGLTISDGRGVGLLHNAASGRHNELAVRNNSDTGVWVQNSDDFEISDPSSVIAGNKLAGIIVQSSANIKLRDATVENTATSPWFPDTGPHVDIGDGVHIRNSVENVSLEALQLLGNQRTNLLLDVGEGDIAGIRFDRVTVRAAGPDGYGAIGQNAAGLLDPGSGWDVGIVRDEYSQMNDIALAQALGAVDTITGDNVPVCPLDIVGIIGPNN